MNDNTLRIASAIVVLGTGGVALADEVTVRWSSEYVTGDTVRVWADLEIAGDVDFSGFASSVFSVLGNDPFGQSINHDEGQGLGRYFRFDGADEGLVQGDDILGIDEFQMPELLTNDHDGSSTILEFFEFEYTITDFTARSVTYTSDHLNFAVYTDGWGSNEEYDWVSVPTSFDIGEGSVIPLPTTAALAGVGLLGVSGRRRRATL